MSRRRLCLLTVIVLLLGAASSFVHAQPAQDAFIIVVSPDRDDWTYRPGDEATFTVSAFHYGTPYEGEVRWTVRPEKMEPVKSGTLKLENGRGTITGGTMNEPGFLRCWAYIDHNGKTYDGCGTAAFSPDAIEPTTVEPDDFMTFWEEAKEAAGTIPLDAVTTHLSDRSTSKYDVYEVNIQNYRHGNRVYGILCMPKGDGQFPAVLRVPGAGIRPYRGFAELAERGIITLEIGIHGIPVTMDTGVYQDMWAPLHAYWTVNLDDRDEYYYKRVYLGCVRAVDYIETLPEFDGEHIGVTGGSQGGALSIVTAALDPRIDCLGAYCPALCDLTGYLHGRAGGWPHLFNEQNINFNGTEKRIETSRYYDVANFARYVHVPGFYSWGFNDTTCPPTSMHAAYNVIPAEKELLLVRDARHWIYPEQRETTNDWLVERLSGE